MKRIFYALVFSAGIYACNTGTEKGDADSPGEADRESFFLEDLLTVKNESELQKKYPQSKITFDTIWGGEGEFMMGTYLDQGTENEVEIYWVDDAKREEIYTVIISAGYDASGNATFGNKWKSSTGVRLGMGLDSLAKLNGKEFTFSGFDWDYGGGVSWEEGKLANERVGVTLGHSNTEPELTEEEMAAIIGDHDVKSTEPVVKKAQPVVVRLSVSRKD
jgi:hypothetical protein